MDGLTVGHRDKGQVDLRLLGSRKFDFRLLSSLLQTGHGLLVFGKVNTRFLLEFSNHPVDDLLVEVVTTEFVVSGSRFDFDLGLAIDFVDLQHRHVKGSATKVVHQDGLVLRLVDTVGECSSGWLVDDAQHLETSDSTSIFRRFALGRR